MVDGNTDETDQTDGGGSVRPHQQPQSIPCPLFMWLKGTLIKLTPLMKTDRRQVNLAKKTRNYDIAMRRQAREKYIFP
jgi:hypothetical protein